MKMLRLMKHSKLEGEKGLGWDPGSPAEGDSGFKKTGYLYKGFRGKEAHNVPEIDKDAETEETQ